MGGGVRRLARLRGRRYQALAGRTMDDLLKTALPPAATTMAARLVDEAATAVGNIDKKALWARDPGAMELFTGAVIGLVANSTELVE